eukprot:scaffold29226_cov110-Isochrysis_galbana.AAC.10
MPGGSMCSSRSYEENTILSDSEWAGASRDRKINNKRGKGGHGDGLGDAPTAKTQRHEDNGPNPTSRNSRLLPKWRAA